MRWLVALISLFAVVTVGLDARAQRRPTKPPSGEPTHRSNLPPERRPVVPTEEETAGKTGPAEGELFIIAWQQALARVVPGPVAWGVLTAPAWLPLLVVLALWLRRRRAPQGPSLRPAGKPQPTAPRPEADLTPVASGGRPRRQTHVQTKKEQTSNSETELSREHELLLARHEGAPSIYDLFVSLGPGVDVIQALRRAAASTLDANRWSGTVRDGRAERLQQLCVQWVRELAVARLSAWLTTHPLVAERKLLVQVPGSLEPGEVDGLSLTEADGLAASLSAEQEELLQQARQALALVAGASEQPLVLLATAASTGLALLPVGTTEINEGVGEVYSLCLLLGGMTILDLGAVVALSQPSLGAELREALREHSRLVATPVPAEGCAAHALHFLGGSNLEGIGILLAAVAGAAYSPSTVVLRLSKQVGSLREASALARLGELVEPLLDDESSEEGQGMQASIRWILGEERLERETKRAATLVRETERLLAKEPLWRAGAGAPANPDAALVELHQLRVAQALSQAVLARERLLHTLEKLATAGETASERAIAARRLGYAIAGLGMPLLRAASTEVLSAGREALAEMR